MSVMTEEEARRKWCPFARWDPGVSDNGAATNRHGDGGKPFITQTAAYRCIASSCMAWRWGAPQRETTWTSGEPPEGDDWTAPTDEKQRPGDSVRWERSVTIRRGFCGLGGRP